jgi:hypothetical protein
VLIIWSLAHDRFIQEMKETSLASAFPSLQID